LKSLTTTTSKIIKSNNTNLKLLDLVLDMLQKQ
jgi:hypothetical protein